MGCSGRERQSDSMAAGRCTEGVATTPTFIFPTKKCPQIDEGIFLCGNIFNSKLERTLYYEKWYISVRLWPVGMVKAPKYELFLMDIHFGPIHALLATHQVSLSFVRNRSSRFALRNGHPLAIPKETGYSMKRSLVLLLLLLTTSVLGLSQAISVNGGSIQGTITDPSGAVVPGATVTITGTDTGYKVTLTTNSSGLYSVGPLNPGAYNIRIGASGFSDLSVETVVRTGTATNGSFRLHVGDSHQTIEVTEGSVQVNTEQVGVSNVITQHQLETLPVNGRNILDFAQLQPGVQLQPGGSDDGGFDPTKAGYSALSFSGISGRTTRILLDGQDITDETVGTTIFNVSQGSVGEMQVNRGNQDASMDIGSSGSVLAATRSGTNRFHGQLFYNFQDQRAGAATFDGDSNPFQRNQFGGGIGGPILKDKLFFFANAERLKQDQSAPSVPGSLFESIRQQYPNIGSPARDTYSAGRLDYNGPRSTHFFVRVNYESNAFNSGANYSTDANRDNTPGIAGGADFVTGRFTHSIRGSYEKFHNLLVDTTAGNTSLYNPLPGIGVTYSGSGLTTGPNPNVPQQTYQTDKQLRYDGSWTRGRNSLRFGASLNRILGGGLAAFFGNGPQVVIAPSSLIGDPSDPIKGYTPNSIRISNDQGYASEKPGFGLPGGFQGDWRTGFYLSDAIKVTPSFTLTIAARYDRDTGRTNSDLAPIPCSSIVTSNFNFGASGAPCTGNAHLLDLWGAGLGDRVQQPNRNVGPQIGFAYNPAASPKTVLRGGLGIFFESNVFNNTQFDRSSRLPSGQFAAYPRICRAGIYSYPIPGKGVVTATSTGVPISTICNESVAQGATAILQLQADARSGGNASIANTQFAGYGLAIHNGAIAYAPKYQSPYSININFGIQQEISKGVVLSADYVHIATLRFQQTLDANHVGDSRYFSKTAAQAAIAATLSQCGAASIDVALAPGGCPSGSGANSNATISDFATNGLDSGVGFGGSPSSASGIQAAFPGINPNVGVGTFSYPIGKSAYDGLQINLREQKNNPIRGIAETNFEVSYAYSRFISSAGGGGSDQFFSPASFNNRNPTQNIGYGNLDRTHILSFGGAMQPKWGPRIGVIAHFNSPSALDLTFDSPGTSGEIFRSDVNGDGQTGSAVLISGTDPGAYERKIGPGSLNKFINGYNSTQAGTLTPAGQVLVDNGLFTAAQLAAAGAIKPTLANAPTKGLSNSMVRTMDANFSYPFHISRLGESFSIEPAVAIYNVANFANYSDATGTVLADYDAGAANFVNGPADFDTKNGLRVPRRTGVYSQGAPRATEFQLKVNF